jgi:hypothetical protein
MPLPSPLCPTQLTGDPLLRSPRKSFFSNCVATGVQSVNRGSIKIPYLANILDEYVKKKTRPLRAVLDGAAQSTQRLMTQLIIVGGSGLPTKTNGSHFHAFLHVDSGGVTRLSFFLDTRTAPSTRTLMADKRRGLNTEDAWADLASTGLCWPWVEWIARSVFYWRARTSSSDRFPPCLDTAIGCAPWLSRKSKAPQVHIPLPDHARRMNSLSAGKPCRTGLQDSYTYLR